MKRCGWKQSVEDSSTTTCWMATAMYQGSALPETTRFTSARAMCVLGELGSTLFSFTSWQLCNSYTIQSIRVLVMGSHAASTWQHCIMVGCLIQGSDLMMAPKRQGGLGRKGFLGSQHGALHVRIMTALVLTHCLWRRCREFVKEEEADKVLFRNTFGTQRLGGWVANMFDLYLKNPANTNVFEWNSQLFAIWEASCPPATSPHTCCRLSHFTAGFYYKITHER